MWLARLQIMYTKWVGDAVRKYYREHSATLEEVFVKKGFALAADGSEDHLLYMGADLQDVKMPTEAPPAPPPRLTRKEAQAALLAKDAELRATTGTGCLTSEPMQALSLERERRQKAAAEKVESARRREAARASGSGATARTTRPARPRPRR